MAKSKDASPPSGPPSILDTTQVHGYYMANTNVSLPDVFFFQRSRLPYLRETNAMGVAACKRSW
ncbi:hypothetical protein SNOG_10048 [Parastagonospora nodorum SN15]|uniref:Uncharacterized protein n=1 Tax=Phaeosphaeria nodorum (strain SN15 / ATCC MYA-4574 / FGSC 10173) TaxID=321614 RepID=Q0UDW6_PHANO|nr:hypothetical protein SNOG_10048 [Parastagonospora nodorum SN15]EAT82383.1 hypothetical protein SNOG_10048 [Parastagonospora nodorum SN15]